jgi:23S rRNA (cytosine1962-C5)-methyltransferase
MANQPRRVIIGQTKSTGRDSREQDKVVLLKPGRERPVVQGHPWIFRGSIEHIPDTVIDGEIVEVCAADGAWLGRGYLNRASQITVRLLTWQRDETIDNAFWERRLTAAIDLRRRLFASEPTTTYRLINAESDFLPGLTVDRYGPVLVMQVGTLGIDRHKMHLAQRLLALTGSETVLERSAMAVRQHEGLGDAGGVLAGAEPPPLVTVQEQGLAFQIDLLHGQKTGFFTDQRDNRRRVAAYCRGGRVVNAFSYTGAFAVYALAAGASHVINIDSSIDALEMAEQNLRLNGFDPDVQTENLAGDVFDVLRDWRQELTPDHHFDVIILDPPKFAQNKGQVERALRGYKEINLSAFHLLRPGGILATFSCSGLVSVGEFQQAVFNAAADAGRRVQVLEWLRQGNDHPVAVTFPEGDYLKGLVCRVL